jgi:hypothetical protein
MDLHHSLARGMNIFTEYDSHLLWGGPGAGPGVITISIVDDVISDTHFEELTKLGWVASPDPGFTFLVYSLKV